MISHLGDSISGSAAHSNGRLAEQRVQEQSLEGGEGLGGEVVVERQGLVCGGAEEQPAEEHEREGAHLGGGERVLSGDMADVRARD